MSLFHVFHNFNVFFRDDEDYEVKCFTAAQIPDIAGRTYPPSLAGRLYPKGIPIYDESGLADLIKKYQIDTVVFSYSDVSHEEVMHKASIALAAGASFMLLGPNDTMLSSNKPVIAVCAVRTGAGKSPASRRIVEILRKLGLRVVVIRHPMPYGDLEKQAVQRFASYEDLGRNKCTIEEREEYEPHIEKGVVVYAGVDYERILRLAEKEADVIVFDGGNNDFSFIKARLYITILDPQRPGHETRYHPGETNLRLADVLIVNKVDSSNPANVKAVMESAAKYNPTATIIKANLAIDVERPDLVKGRSALVIEDGPTLTHGGMSFGAGTLAAKKYGARIIDAERFAAGSIKEVYRKFPHLKNVLPAMGYSAGQIKELEATINKADCEVVVDGSPINLSRLIKVNKPVVNVRYHLEEIGQPDLENVIRRFLAKITSKKKQGQY
jgi:predicted GTPase